MKRILLPSKSFWPKRQKRGRDCEIEKSMYKKMKSKEVCVIEEVPLTLLPKASTRGNNTWNIDLGLVGCERLKKKGFAAY